MPLDSIVQIDISLADPPAGLIDFSVPLIATTLTTDQATAFGSDRTRVLTPANWRSNMAEVGVASTDDPFLAFLALFSQDLKPARAIWGRRLPAVAMVRTITIDASPANGTYTMTINGVDYSFIASSSTQTDVANGLRALLAADTDAVVSGTGTTTVILTADEAGVPFTSDVSVSGGADPLSIATTTPNTGLVEDLAEITDEDPSWYMLLENAHSVGVIGSIAPIVEGLERVFLGQTDDADAQGTASLTDIASVLTALNLARTAIVWHDDADDFVDAALAGRVLPTKPGSNTWANQVLRGVGSILPTDEGRLRSKRYTWNELFRAANFSMSQGGRTVGGYPLDLIIGRDWLKNLIQVREAELLRNSPKIPYTREGAQAVGAVLRTALLEASAAPYNFLDADTIKITIPNASSQSSTDRGNRHFPGVTWQATAQGAIETMEITGTISA